MNEFEQCSGPSMLIKNLGPPPPDLDMVQLYQGHLIQLTQSKPTLPPLSLPTRGYGFKENFLNRNQ